MAAPPRPRTPASFALLFAAALAPVVVPAPGAAQGTGRGTASGGVASGDSARITAIADALWARIMATDPATRLRTGASVRTLPVPSVAQAEENAAVGRRILAQLDSAGAQPVGSEAWSLAAVTRARAAELAAEGDGYWFHNPVSPYGNGFGAVHGILSAHRVAAPADLDRYLDLAEQYAGVVDAVHAYLRGQERHGYRMPKPEVAAALTLLRQFRAEPARSPVAVAEARLRGVRAQDSAAVARFERRLADEVTERVNPAFDRLIGWLEGPYLAAAPATVGLAQYPGGEAQYRRLVRASLTIDRTPEQVHALGLREIARITAELDSIRGTLGRGGAFATREAFHRYLRTAPRFVPSSPDVVRDKMLGHLATLRPRLGEQFAVVPRAPYDVRRLDPALEAGMTYGYYRQPSATDSTGVYFFNGGQLEQKTTVWFEGLAYHEILPGHHYHLALVQELLATKHPLRRNYASTAYTEGWAEYAAALAESMGGYRDPYDRYGRRIMELYSAARLVLDTGLNLLGWSHERALAYLRANSVISDAEVASEVLRYCCDIPGQALGYRMGMLTFQELRARAERALGPRFDPKAFHQVILGDGPLPFFALEQRVDAWLAQQGAR
ncbi:MAG: DUF885 family protein [Gemmatimonadetes bacterium]|nr:DUF885 family protein [Gemmatimonadota bacterium]